VSWSDIAGEIAEKDYMKGKRRSRAPKKARVRCQAQDPGTSCPAGSGLWQQSLARHVADVHAHAASGRLFMLGCHRDPFRSLKQLPAACSSPAALHSWPAHTLAVTSLWAGAGGIGAFVATASLDHSCHLYSLATSELTCSPESTLLQRTSFHACCHLLAAPAVHPMVEAQA